MRSIIEKIKEESDQKKLFNKMAGQPKGTDIKVDNQGEQELEFRKSKN
jgi:hypothetical protein